MFARLKNKFWRFIYNAAKAGAEAALNDDAADIQRQLQRDAMRDSARYVLENAELHKVFDTREALLDHCLGLIAADGMILEFGVYRGHTIRRIAERFPDRQVFGFDSFEGLPEPWIFNRKGIFSDVDGALPEVPDNAVLIKGLFQETSPDFLAKHPGPVALLHVDSDIYSSCKYVLETYGDRIRPGTVIVFDDFYNYPGWRDGEFRAFYEWCGATRARHEVIGFTARPVLGDRGLQLAPQQVAVRIVGLGDPAAPAS